MSEAIINSSSSSSSTSSTSPIASPSSKTNHSPSCLSSSSSTSTSSSMAVVQVQAPVVKEGVNKSDEKGKQQEASASSCLSLSGSGSESNRTSPSSSLHSTSTSTSPSSSSNSLLSLSKDKDEQTEDENNNKNKNKPNNETMVNKAEVELELEAKEKEKANNVNSFKSLKDRNKPPISFYISLFLVISLQFSNGFYSTNYVPTTLLPSIKHSFHITTSTIMKSFPYVISLYGSIISNSNSNINTNSHNNNNNNNNKQYSIKEYIQTTTIIILLSSIFYVVVYLPFKAGMWTNRQRIKKHKLHRYFGLSFLILYFLAWVEFTFHYDDSFRFSFLPLLIAFNGLIQAHSAYFSFKVLPDLKDAGYLSDVAVLSRSFVHENSFFQLMTFFGAIYYGPSSFAHTASEAAAVTTASTTIVTCFSTLIEYAFIFYPYMLIRIWFPITRFKDAGSRPKGRSERNERFYAWGTTAVKVFYLWAKYFLGFYINFLIFLHNRNINHVGATATYTEQIKEVVSYSDIKFIRGLYLLNAGTVSTGVFLHTLRFKKVIPPRLMLCLYLTQIYLTFLAVPYLGHLFLQHYQLMLLVLAGMACNMTRSRKIHALWCVTCHYLLVHSDIEW